MNKNTILYVIILILLMALAYLYGQNNGNTEIVPSSKPVSSSTNQETEAASTSVVKEVQLALKRVGYKVPTDGVMEERTEGSIRDFEEKNGLIVTGKADAVILKELKLAYQNLDKMAWEQALAENTLEALENYRSEFPEGQYVDQIDATTAKIQQETAAAEKAAAEKAQKQAQAAKRERDRIAREKKLAGTTHKDCDQCPTMVYVPSGRFKMGSNNGSDDEKPVRTVSVGAFHMGQSEVTFSQWDACYNDGGCKRRPDDEGWGRGSKPVINVSWNDAQTYIAWLRKKTGKKYRLPSEAEWEYAARAGSTRKYSMGDNISCGQAKFDAYGSCAGDENTVRVKSYQPNNFGLYDMHGNVWEWVADCYHDDYHGAPKLAKPWVSSSDCSRVLRGGSWNFDAGHLRSANRDGGAASIRSSGNGFRVAQDTE